MDYFKGDIFKFSNVTNAMNTGVVCSAHNDGAYVLAIMLTDRGMDAESTVQVNTKDGVKYANCGMVRFVRKDEADEFLKVATESEMDEIDKALAYVLGIETKTEEDHKKPQGSQMQHCAPKDSGEEERKLFATELIRFETEANIYKELYLNLLEKVSEGN